MSQKSTLSVTVTLIVAFSFVDFRLFGSMADDLDFDEGGLDNGFSPWCFNKRYPGYNLTNMNCCGEDYRCNWYLRPGFTLHGLFNDGLFTRHRCSCARKLYNCNISGGRNMFDIFNIKAHTCRDVCAKRNSVTNKLEWVNSTEWLSDCSLFKESTQILENVSKS